MPRILRIDFETRSLADLKTVGAWCYAEHPSTDVLCMAVSVDGEDPFILTDFSAPLEIGPDDEIHAFNVFFEYVIWLFVLHGKYGWPMPTPSQFHDTQAQACAMSLPANLEQLAIALEITEKDASGKALINWFSKPVSAGSHKGEFRLPADHPEKFEAFCQYCKQDVRVEMAASRMMRKLSPSEREFWLSTFETNIRGVGVDLGLVQTLQSFAARAREDLDAEIQMRTNGELNAQAVSNNHRKLAAYLGMESVDAEHVEDELLDPSIGEESAFLLRARQSLGQSTGKLQAFVDQTASDGRTHGYLRYHGAHTGRDTSLGVNLLNLPRGAKVDVPKLVAFAKAGDYEGFRDTADGDAMTGIVSCFRACLVPAKGMKFVQCDYSTIEPRVGGWVAGDDRMVGIIEAHDRGVGPEIYMVQAAAIRGLPIEKVGRELRQEGKVGVLGPLYRCGAKTLRVQAKKNYGVLLDDFQAEHVINIYRDSYPKILDAWTAIEKLGQVCCETPNTCYEWRFVKAFHDGKHLWMRLPSGRVVCYPYAKWEGGFTPYGAWRKGLTAMFATHTGFRRYPCHGGDGFNTVVQGTAGCLLRHSVLALRNSGLNVVLRVYDELVCEVPEDTDYETFRSIFLSKPDWAADIPVAGEGWEGCFYRKD